MSTCGDVYSYGILLLEMVTGKRPTNEMFKEGLHLHNYAKLALPDRVAEITDPFLLQERGNLETSTKGAANPIRSMKDDRIMECLISIFGIGVTCSTEMPGERMNIRDVATELCSIRDKLIGTS